MIRFFLMLLVRLLLKSLLILSKKYVTIMSTKVFIQSIFVLRINVVSCPGGNEYK